MKAAAERRRVAALAGLLLGLDVGVWLAALKLAAEALR